MSLLMFQLHSRGVNVYTDTLATNAAGRAAAYTSKCFPVPHMGVLIAFTGVARLGQEWAYTANTSMLSLDIDMLNQHTPEQLRKLWKEITQEHPEIADHTCTVYQFGHSDDQSAHVGFAYRSTADFEPEQLPPDGFSIKPHPSAEIERTPENLGEIIALAETVQSEQNNRPITDRIHIGGVLVESLLAGDQILTRPIHLFKDFEDTWTDMNRHISATG
jgi:hypothetical protein